MRRMIRTIVLLLGVFCMASAGYLFVDHQQEEQLAQTVSHDVASAFGEQVQLINLAEPELVPLAALPMVEEQAQDASAPAVQTVDSAVQEMPAVVIDGAQYIALLSIPWLGLELPVAQNCNDENLDRTPCAFSGSIAKGNLVIAGHNYKAHFGGVNRLELGATAVLTDALGQAYTYSLVEKEQVDGDDASAIVSGEWDMTLFTCVYGDNTQRDVLRFQLQE